MSLNDDKDAESWRLFPTREGRATGHSNERTMLEAVGGQRTIRTQIRDNPDGSTTMLRTRGGFSEFTTTEVKKDSTSRKKGPFLYYKLASPEHPFGWGKRASDGRMSAKWQWPGYPVSYSEVRPTTTELTPHAFESFDGPGTLTWEDTRAVPQTKAILSWSPAYGNGRSAPTSYMAGNLASVLPDTPTHTYTFDGGTAVNSPGRFLPGQRMIGVGGHLRFVQVPSETYLYEDGKFTGVHGYILAACIVAGQDERWRTIEFVPRQTSSENIVLKTKAHRKDGTFAGSATVTVNLPGYLRLTEIIQPPRFNSSGTQAAGIVRYARTGTDGASVAVIVIDWASATASLGPVKADSFDTVEFSLHPQSENGHYFLSNDEGFDFTGERQVSVPLITDYSGDSLRLLWTKQRRVYEEHRTVMVSGNNESMTESISVSHSSNSTSTMELFLDDAVIKSTTSSWSGELNSSATLTREMTNPERPWLLRDASVSSEGTWTKTYSPFAVFITDVMADLRRGVIACCTETVNGYSDTGSESISRVFRPGYPDLVNGTQSRQTPAVTSSLSVEVLGVGQVATVSGIIIDAVEYNGTEDTRRSVAFRADYGGPTLDAEAYNRADTYVVGWDRSIRATNSQLVESLSMAVDKSGGAIFISGLLSNGLAKVFTPFAKIIRDGGPIDMPVSVVPSDEGQPGDVWVSEPIFLDVEVKP